MTLRPGGIAAQRSSDQRDPAYAARATAILVDVVVRDKQGRPVLDLRPQDFEIAEDGVPQEIGSFTLVSKGAGIGIDVRLRKRDEPPTTVVQPTGAAEPSNQTFPSVVALVFDALSPESMVICQKAALQHISMMGETQARIGVFASEPSLRVIQRYTSEPALIRTAVQKLTAMGTEAKLLRDERLLQLRAQQAAMQTAGFDPTAVGPINGGALGQNASQIGNAEVQRLLVQGEIRMIQAFDALDRDQRGYGSTNTLIAVLQSMQFLPGRKSVVFFSEGLPASPVLQTQLQSVVEAANRANITIYAVDATGLRVMSSTTETRREVQALGEQRLRDANMPESRTEGPLTRGMERTEDLMRYNGEGGLARVSEDTGGFLIRDTNDVGSAFRRIDEDLRFHYLLTYSPTNDVLDGKFRTISVKVNRPGVNVFSRKGYRAIRTSSAPILSYEAPALVMLDSARLPNAFPSQASAYAFPEQDRPGLTPVVVRVKTADLQFDIDSRKSTYSAQAVVLVRVRDSLGQVVNKLSQQYVLNGDSAELETAKKGEILFYREPDLQPGAYQVESIVYDTLAEKGSARVTTVVVPGPDSPQLRMSSLVLVSRTEQSAVQPGVKADRAAPFYYGDTLMYPNVGEPLKRGVDSLLPFYFVVYPAPGRCACTAHIALLQNGKPLADATRTLETTGKARLQHVGQLPIDNLPPGVYELRVTVTDNQDQQTRTAFFTIS